MVLDRQGGPNWFKNWCIAPVIVDPEADEVYFTPLYYVMSHFSKYMRPGAEVLSSEVTNGTIMAAAVKNPDGSLAIAVFNESDQKVGYVLDIDGKTHTLHIPAQSLQTVVVKN